MFLDNSQENKTKIFNTSNTCPFFKDINKCIDFLNYKYYNGFFRKFTGVE